MPCTTLGVVNHDIGRREGCGRHALAVVNHAGSVVITPYSFEIVRGEKYGGSQRTPPIFSPDNSFSVRGKFATLWRVVWLLCLCQIKLTDIRGVKRQPFTRYNTPTTASNTTPDHPASNRPRHTTTYRAWARRPHPSGMTIPSTASNPGLDRALAHPPAWARRPVPHGRGGHSPD
jgi:hypothetical protein